MYTLATQHWESRQQVNTSRVTWVHDAVMQYFHEGEMQRITEKEMRKLDHLGLKLSNDPDVVNRYTVSLTSRIKVLDVGSCYNPFSVYKDFDVTAVDLCPAHQSVKKCDFLSLEVFAQKTESNHLETCATRNSEVSLQSDKSETINKTSAILDTSQTTELRTSIPSATLQAAGNVESFLECTLEEKQKGKQSIIDTSESSFRVKTLHAITPKNKKDSAAVCDNARFLHVNDKILTEMNSRTETVTLEGIPEPDIVTCLESNSFDVVVFCLLLEYIPSPKQRLLCCQKAYHLLKPNGILCIITPDSKHQNANVHIYKLWKITLGYLGFSRTKYEKLTHFHGMVFRKGLCREAWELDATRQLSLMKKTNVKNKFVGIDYEKVKGEMYIPQDFQDLSESEEETPDDESQVK
ncbi:S-adenosylmethionine sensor upstream of mTORC1 isoform X2 [Panulirus ornatus]